MSLWKKIFGIGNKPSPAATSDRPVQRPQATGPAKAKAPSEKVKDWIRAGGLIGPVGIETRVPLSPGSREECEQTIQSAIAEYDQMHPERRVDEPPEIEYVAPPDDGLTTAKATLTVSINLKFRNVTDFKESTATKDFFDVFQKHGLPAR